MKRLVYAVLRAVSGDVTEPRLPAGLKAIVVGDLAVAYSEVKVGDLVATVPRLEAFAEVVAELHQEHTVIPFRFGTAFDSDSQLAALLQEHRSEWLESLDQVEQCDEYSVHMLHSCAPCRDPAKSADHGDGRATAEPAKRPGTAYLIARQTELRRAANEQQNAQERADNVRRVLTPLSRDCYVKTLAPGQGELITLVFLVPRIQSDLPVCGGPAFLHQRLYNSWRLAPGLLTTSSLPVRHRTEDRRSRCTAVGCGLVSWLVQDCLQMFSEVRSDRELKSSIRTPSKPLLRSNKHKIHQFHKNHD